MTAGVTNLYGFEEETNGQNFGAFAQEFANAFRFEDEDDSDAFEKLEAGSSIGGLVVPIQFTDNVTGKITDIWGSIDTDGLFDIIDGGGLTHPLMHPMALEACLKIASDWQWIDRSQAEAIRGMHQMMTKQLHTPRITTMLDGSKVAQVMTGYAQLAQRYKTGAYGAMVMDSQGDFLKYVGYNDIMDVMTAAAEGNSNLQSELVDLIGSYKEIIHKMAGEVMAQAVARPTASLPTHRNVSAMAASAPAPTHAPPSQEKVIDLRQPGSTTSTLSKFTRSYSPSR